VKKRLKIILPLALIVVIAIVAVRFFLFRAPFRYAGTVEATEVDVPARVTSVIQTLLAQEGDTVREGQSLLRLSCEDIRISARKAQRDLDRARQLVKQGFLSPQSYDQTRMQYDDAKLKLDWCDVRAPAAGTILTRYHEAGENVAAGTKLFTIADLREVWAYVYVPDPVVPKLTLGMPLTVVIPELKMREIQGTIIKINAEAEFTPKNVQTQEERTRLVYGVKIDFKNNNGLLKPGMTIEAQLPL
jgi:HlyD family secretion protein